MTLEYKLVSTNARFLRHAGLSPSWLKAYGFSLSAAFLTPFFPPLAQHAFNSCIVYHLWKTGGRGIWSYQSSSVPAAPSSLHSDLCALCLPRANCVKGVSAVSPLFLFLLLVSPLSSFPTSLLPRDPLRGVATISPLSLFTATLRRKQGDTGYWPALSAAEGSYQSSPLSAVDCGLLASPSYSPPCPASPFPLKWGYPFPVITGENE